MSETPLRLLNHTFLPPSEDTAILYARVTIGDMSGTTLRLLQLYISPSVHGHRHPLRSRNLANDFTTFTIHSSKDSAIVYALVRIHDFTTCDFAYTYSISSTDSIIHEFSYIRSRILPSPADRQSISFISSYSTTLALSNDTKFMNVAIHATTQRLSRDAVSPPPFAHHR